jgi:hypothetical protein
MNGKTLIEPINPKTQSIEAVKALLAWKGRAVDPLPATVEFMNHGDDSRLMLVLSNDKAGYYVVTQKACSCPAAIYSPGKPCKHQRKFFPQLEAAKPVSDCGSIRPKLPAFKPFSELPSEERRAAGVV